MIAVVRSVGGAQVLWYCVLMREVMLGYVVARGKHVMA